MLAFTHIHHFALSVPDLDAAIAWYGRVLGFQLERRFDFPDSGTNIAHLLSPAGIRLELLYTPDSTPSPDLGLDAFGAIAHQGAKHIGLQVESLEAALAALQSQDVTVLHPIATVEPAGVRNFWVLDLAGNQIEIVQPLTSS